jgi:hypothetical protein
MRGPEDEEWYDHVPSRASTAPHIPIPELDDQSLPMAILRGNRGPTVS